MKKVLIAILMLWIGANLLFAVNIKNIRAQDFNGVACRLVLDLDQSANFSVTQKNNGIQIDIADFDGKDAPRKINSKLIQELRVTSGGVWLSTISGLKYERLGFDDKKQIVLDLYKTVTSRDDRLSLAMFYSDRGLYTKADDLFAELNKDYPIDEEILDKWGELLKRMGTKQKQQSSATRETPAQTAKPAPKPAPEQTAKPVPKPAPKPAPEQTAKPAPKPAPEQIAKPAPKPAEVPKNKEIVRTEAAKPQEPAGKPQLPPQTAEEPRFIELAVEEELDSLYQNDSLVTMKSLPPMQYEKVSIPEIITDMANRHFMLTILFFVGALVIIYILLFGLKKKRNKLAQSIFETKALHRMVGRLLADGWSHKEIAQELKISLSEVKAIADQPQQPEADSAPEWAESEDLTPEPQIAPKAPAAEKEHELPQPSAAEENSFLMSILNEADTSEYKDAMDSELEFNRLYEQDTLSPASETEKPGSLYGGSAAEAAPKPLIEESFTEYAPVSEEPDLPAEPEAAAPEAKTEESVEESTPEDPFRIFISESDVPVTKKR